MTHQISENIELPGRQVYGSTVAKGLPARHPNSEVADVYVSAIFGRRDRRPSQERANAGHELVNPEWLCQVVVRAEIQGMDFGALLTASGKDEYRHARRLPELPGDVERRQAR